ncbi:MAG: ABC transporter [Ruminococcaceae bacterium]|nr:ABC transporter [Oscillospiraceae bacterium]
MNAVFKKEFRSSFHSLTAPVFIAVVLAVMGGFLVMDQFKAAEPQLEYTVIKASFWSLLVTAVLTMRTLSEERRAKTDQLLYFLPITSTQIIMGKFLAMISVFAIPFVIVCIYPVFLSGKVANGDVNFIFTYGTLIGYFLLGCTVIALSMFISSLTDNQILSAIFSLCTFAALYFIGSYIKDIPEDKWMGFAAVIILCGIASVIVYIATNNYIASAAVGAILIAGSCALYIFKAELYTGLFAKIIGSVCIFLPLEEIATVINAKEMFDWTPYVYYLSATALFVFLTVQSFEKRRWN